MQRLGLWGEGAAFRSFEVFLETVQKKGLGLLIFYIFSSCRTSCQLLIQLFADFSYSSFVIDLINNHLLKVISIVIVKFDLPLQIFCVIIGVAEMLAMDMKSSGVYLCRSLSFKQAEV